MRTARVTRDAAGGADLAKGRASSFTPLVFNGPRIDEQVRCPERLIQTSSPSAPESDPPPEPDLPQWNEQPS